MRQAQNEHSTIMHEAPWDRGLKKKPTEKGNTCWNINWDKVKQGERGEVAKRLENRRGNVGGIFFYFFRKWDVGDI